MGAAAPYAGGGAIAAPRISAQRVRTAPATASYQRSRAQRGAGAGVGIAELMRQIARPAEGYSNADMQSLGLQAGAQIEGARDVGIGNLAGRFGTGSALFASQAPLLQLGAGAQVAGAKRDLRMRDLDERIRQEERKAEVASNLVGLEDAWANTNRGIDSGEIQQINALGQGLSLANRGMTSGEMTGNADRDLNAQGQNANNALQAAGMNMQNAQFGATFGEGQRQFDAGFGLDQDRLGLSRDEMDWRRQMELLRLGAEYPDMNMGGQFGGGLGRRPPRAVRRFAKGGRAEGEIAMVGEEGPELAFLPKDTMIVPHMESQMMMANGMPCPMPGQGEMPMEMMGEEMPGYACGGKVKGYAQGGMIGSQDLMGLIPMIQARERRKRMAQSPNRGLIPMADFGPPPERYAGPPMGDGPGAPNLLSRQVNPMGITAGSPEAAAMRALRIQRDPGAPAAAYGGMSNMGGPELADMNRRYVMQAGSGAGGMEHEIGRIGKGTYDLDSFEGREGFQGAKDEIQGYFDDQNYARRRAEMGDERFLQKPITKRAMGGMIGDDTDAFGNPVPKILDIQDGYNAGPITDPARQEQIFSQFANDQVPSGGGYIEMGGKRTYMAPAPPSAEGLRRDRFMTGDASRAEYANEMTRRRAMGANIPPAMQGFAAQREAEFEEKRGRGMGLQADPNGQITAYELAEIDRAYGKESPEYQWAAGQMMKNKGFAPPAEMAKAAPQAEGPGMWDRIKNAGEGVLDWFSGDGGGTAAQAAPPLPPGGRTPMPTMTPTPTPGPGLAEEADPITAFLARRRANRPPGWRDPQTGAYPSGRIKQGRSGKIYRQVPGGWEEMPNGAVPY